MWLDALDLVLQRLKEDGLDFSRVRGISGAGMQHGTVFWAQGAADMLAGLKGDKSLIEQLGDGGGGKEYGAFAHPHSPNWQDASTQKQCEAFDAFFGSPEELANVTGSSAHHVSCFSRACEAHTANISPALQWTSDHAFQAKVPRTL
jgi:xylulokinase